MKYKKLLKHIFYLVVIVQTSLVYAQSTSINSVEMLLNNYFRDQAIKQVELLLPKGKFVLTVKVQADEKKVKETKPTYLNSLKLPLSEIVLDESELKSLLNTTNLNTETAEKLLSFIKKIEIKVSVVPTVNKAVRELIAQQITSTLALSPERGDSIVVDELPESFSNVWSSSSEFLSSSSAFMKPALYIAGAISIVLIIASAILYLSLMQFGSKMSSEAKAMAAALKDVFESSQSKMPSYPTQQNQTMMNQQSGVSPSLNKDLNLDSTKNFSWNKVELDTLIAFIYDCLDHPQYSSIIPTLMNTVLDPEQSKECEAKIPEVLSKVMFSNSENKFSVLEITNLFQSNLLEYRRACRSPMSKLAMNIPMSKIIDLSANLKDMELALLVNSLTPLKRSWFLKQLLPETKLKLAQVASKNYSTVEHKRFEVSLSEKLDELQKQTSSSSVKEDTHSMSYLKTMFLKAESFKEDESFFEATKQKEGNDLDSTNEYISVLNALECFDEATWNSFNLQDLAIAYSGYSNSYKEKLISKFNGKKVEWLKNFLTKIEAQGGVDFLSPQVQSIHEMIKSKIQTLMAQNQSLNQKAS